MKRLLVLVVIIIILAIASIAAWWVFSRSSENTNTPSAIEEQTNAGDTTSVLMVNYVPPVEMNDDDRDGLSNDEERTAGTDSTKIDSDLDGLTDMQEAKVYKTKPLVKDTDGDGMTDGDEVNANRNPLGEGALLDFNKALEGLTPSN